MERYLHKILVPFILLRFVKISVQYLVEIMNNIYSSFSGPVASILINRHGCRTVTIFGSILGCLGYFASVFVEDLYYLYITMGIIAGWSFFIL